MKTLMKRTLTAMLSLGLCLGAMDAGAEGPGPGLQVHDVQYRDGDRRWSCRGLRGFERDRCERRQDRRDDAKDLKNGIAAGVIGLTIGAIIAGAAKEAEEKRQNRAAWLERCAARYRSFDPRTGTFVGNDGLRYRCP